MLVTVKCRQCGKVYRIRPEKRHKRFRCRECGNIAETVGSKQTDADDAFLATLAAAEEEAATLPAVGSHRPSSSPSDRNGVKGVHSKKSKRRPAEKTVFWKTPAFAAGLVAATMVVGAIIYYRHRSTGSTDHNPPAGDKNHTTSPQQS